MDEIITIEVEILPDIYVVFSGEPEFHDDSFTHEFGTEVIKYWCIDEFTWDKKNHTEERNNTIEKWLSYSSNKEWILDNLNKKLQK